MFESLLFSLIILFLKTKQCRAAMIQSVSNCCKSIRSHSRKCMLIGGCYAMSRLDALEICDDDANLHRACLFLGKKLGFIPE